MSSGKAGYVYKEGAKFLTWKKRFLVVERDKLSYYTKDSMKSKKGEILIRTIKEVNPVSQYKGRRFIMGIVTTTGRTYYIQGSDQENVQSWINSINEVIGKTDSPSVAGNTLNAPPARGGAQQNAPPPRASYEPPAQVAPASTNQAEPSLGNAQDQPAAQQQPQAQAQAGGDPSKVGVDDFETMKVIGRGGFGRVLLVRKHDTGKVYAMKILKKAVIAARGEIEHTRTEKSVLSKLKHPFLAGLHWSFQTKENLYIIMDFINGGELFHHLSREKRFSEERAKFYSAQIVAGMGYLHANGVIYRDLKPENLLLSAAGNIIMTDFGLSKEGLHASDSRTATFCGTPEYLAPEIIRGDDYTKAIDWWSVGTLIYEMLTGLPPFYTEDEENMYHKIMTADLVVPSFFSPEVGDIIRQFLQRDPQARLQEEANIRAHPWFADIDWDKLLNLEMPPPFVPNVKSAEDVGNIDDEFLEEDVDQVDEDGPSAPVGKDAFQGFTFVEDD
eukprot:TRINITY_DN84_c0_g4_i1.p1 TRINITY_DN84_c0_g4~~TRINITY_DN84_c0_g4_i1.p1  ORF type:complete len:513 (+),score=144.10 TRINITY_DN84_c0_g4_i1:40-1539(+)